MTLLNSQDYHPAIVNNFHIIAMGGRVTQTIFFSRMWHLTISRTIALSKITTKYSGLKHNSAHEF